MMMDANDVLFVGEPKQILDAYQELDAPIVASAERGCAPQGSGIEEDLLCVSCHHGMSPHITSLYVTSRAPRSGLDLTGSVRCAALWRSL